MKPFKKMLTAILLVILVCVWAGCDKETVAHNESTNGANQQDSAPVSLSFYAQANSIAVTDDDFQNSIVKPIQRKYPNYQLSFVKKGPGFSLDELAAAGNLPDIIMGTFGDMAKLRSLNIPVDLQPFMKSNRFDTSALDSSVLEAVKTYSPEGQFLFIPYAVNTAALYYNKDIFDKFGIPYPGDNLSWDDTFEIAKKLTRSDGGVQYQGFDMDTGFMANNNQLSISYIKPGADKLNSEGLKPWFAEMRQFYDFPSLTLASGDIGNRNRFLKDKDVAMYAAGNMFNLLSETGDLNWDMAALPTFKEAQGVGLEPNTPYYAISSTSKSKEQAFRAIAVLLTRESQTAQTRNGLLTVLNDTEIKKQVMQDTPFKNKHTEALYKNKFAAPRYVSDYDQFTNVVGMFKDMVVGKKDLNTLFREGEESAQQKIDEYKAGNGK